MSDRTKSSVRTGSRAGNATASAATPEADQAGEQAPTSATQSIPTTGTQVIPTTGTQAIPTTGAQRAQSAGDGTTSGRSGTGTASVPPQASPPRTGAAPASTGASPSTGAQASPTTGAAPAAAAPVGGTSAGPGPQATAAPAASAPAATVTSRSRPGGRVGGRGPRRARLQLRHIDTWSALKISLILSIALFFIWMVAVGILYGVLSQLGVFDTLNDLFGQLGTASGADSAGGGEVITAGVVFGGAAFIGAVNIVLLTALCTVATFIYNLCSDLVGGLEVTLSERD